MVGNQSPRKTLRLGFADDQAQAIHEKLPIRVIIEYFSATIAPGNNMVQSTGSVYPGLTWHGF